MSISYNKPAPNQNTILVAAKVLFSYGHFKWNEADGFRIDKQCAARFKTWIDGSVKSGKLVRGTWQKRTWIGYTALSRLVRAYFERAIYYGTSSWDVTIARSLSMALVASLGVRTGDVGQSRLYSGTEYMQFRHIELSIEGNEAIFANIRASVTIEFAKGLKDELNNDPVRYLRPLNEAHNSHVCPIALLLVHSLRHSLVAGTSLQEVLDNAFRRPDRTVVWLFPDRPVLPAFALAPLRCDLDKPARPDQMLHTIREMGLVSGMLDRAYGHALRHGSARDTAHLSSRTMDGAGVATDGVRQSLGHTHRTMHNGITETYVGGSSAELYNARAAQPTETRRAPRFATSEGDQPFDLVKERVSEEEIRQAIDRSTQPLSRKAAIAQVRAKRMQGLSPTVDREQRGATMEMLVQPSPMPPSSAFSLPSARQAATVSRIPLSPKDANAPQARSSLAEAATQVIDPALLAEDELAVAAADVELSAAHELRAIVENAASRTDEPHSPQDEASVLDQLDCTDAGAVSDAAAAAGLEEAAVVLLGADANPKANAVTPVEWIAAYSRYNIIDNYYFAQRWAKHCKDLLNIPQGNDFNNIFGKYCIQGGSRDPPRPLLHRCTKTPGCSYSTAERNALQSHEGHCTALRSEQLLAGMQTLTDDTQLFKCPYMGCSYVVSPSALRPKKDLDNHILLMHKFVPKPCEKGCDPSKIYTDRASYDYHQSTKHSGRWPVRCSFPGCQHPTEFANMSSLKSHLQKKHNIEAAEDLAKYVPSLPPRQKWVEQECFETDCSTVLKTRSAAITHLKNVHKKSQDEIEQLIDDQAVFETVTESRVGGKRAPAAKDMKRAPDLDNAAPPPIKKKKLISS
ncbi:hypothetical protein KC330_g1825 [Hortaea werneckii]|nr:hypothetical protein KC330_g1825 [Hortaea werneckii]